MQILLNAQVGGLQLPFLQDRGYIVKGHGRLKAAKLAGFESVPVEYQNFTSDDEENAALLADNKIAEFSEIDSKLLAQMFEDFNFEEYGDLWILGRHRLICGDSRDTDTYIRLMEDDIADMVITDPPYNVDYEGATGLKIANDNLSDSEFYKFLLDCFTPMSKFLKAGGAVYCWHADSERINFQRALEFAGILIKQNLIWAKNSFVMGRQDYQWKHESCLYGWKEGAAHYFTEKRNIPTVNELKTIEFDKLKKEELVELMKRMLDVPSTILNFNRPTKSTLHPTMKPVDLFIDGIENSSRPGQIIMDAFGGSGTTIIASEKLGRRARVIELSPEYCDAIVKRYLTVFDNTTTKCIREGNEIKSPLKAISE